MANVPSVKFVKSQLMSLANNLTLLIKNKQMTESELAVALDLPSMTIRRLASGETLDPHISTLKKIADYFDISIDSLITNNNLNSPHAMRKSNTSILVPVLDWANASKISATHELDLSNWETWQPIVMGKQVALSEKAFALEGKPSIGPRFSPDTLFVIDPLANPVDGDLVLIKMKNDESLSIREISIDPPKWQLKPTVPGSETLYYSSAEHEIVGTVLLTMLYSKR